MAYLAEVLNVMIASPSDVPQERQIIREAIHEWNAVHSQSRGLVLMPIAWETHSTPALGERPQELINKQLLSRCDLLIAAFWTRLGTPTGVAASGTAEEIEEHLAAGGRAMLYFSSVPARLDDVDEQQYAALKEFRASWRQRGLVESYETLQEFSAKLSRQLAATLIELRPNSQALITPEVPDGMALVRLTANAATLLVEASKDPHGMLLRTDYMGGALIRTNEKQWPSEYSAREMAEWDSALNELVSEDLLQAQGYKNEVFRVTKRGYEAAERIIAQGDV